MLHNIPQDHAGDSIISQDQSSQTHTIPFDKFSVDTEPVEDLSKIRAQNTSAHESATAASGQPPTAKIYITQGRSWALEDAPNVMETLVAIVEKVLHAAQRFTGVVHLHLPPS